MTTEFRRHRPFFMVHVDGTSQASVRHESFAEAEAEAVRLARKTGRAAYVLQAQVGYEIPQPKPECWELIDDWELPCPEWEPPSPEGSRSE